MTVWQCDIVKLWLIDTVTIWHGDDVILSLCEIMTTCRLIEWHATSWMLIDCCNLNCRNDGYVTNKDGVCHCVCPEGLSGPMCEMSATSVKYGCGGEIDLDPHKPAVNISSPNYPQLYKSGVECVWLIKVSGRKMLMFFNKTLWKPDINWQAPEGKLIKTTSLDLDLPYKDARCLHYVEVRDRLLGQVSREWVLTSRPAVCLKVCLMYASMSTHHLSPLPWPSIHHYLSDCLPSTS